MKDVYDRIKVNRKGGKIDVRGGNGERKGKESKAKKDAAPGDHGVEPLHLQFLLWHNSQYAPRPCTWLSYRPLCSHACACGRY